MRKVWPNEPIDRSGICALISVAAMEGRFTWEDALHVIGWIRFRAYRSTRLATGGADEY